MHAIHAYREMVLDTVCAVQLRLDARKAIHLSMNALAIALFLLNTQFVSHVVFRVVSQSGSAHTEILLLFLSKK